MDNFDAGTRQMGLDDLYDQIDDLRKALTIVKAERDHWHGLVPRADRVQFPFTPPQSE